MMGQERPRQTRYARRYKGSLIHAVGIPECEDPWPMSKESLSVEFVDLYLALNVDLREGTRLGAFEK